VPGGIGGLLVSATGRGCSSPRVDEPSSNLMMNEPETNGPGMEPGKKSQPAL